MWAPLSFRNLVKTLLFILAILLISRFLSAEDESTATAVQRPSVFLTEPGNFSDKGENAANSLGSEGGVLERTLTLKDAERLALLNDATVLSAEQDKIVARERVREAGYLFLPEVGVQASATKYNALYPFALPAAGNALLFPKNSPYLGNNLNTIMFGGAYMNMNLYEGGRGVNTYKLAQAAQKQADSRYKAARMNAILAVKRSFYRLLLTQREKKLDQEYLSQVKSLLQNGNLDLWGKLEAQTQLAQAETQYAKISHKLRLERLQFLKSLNLELDTPFKIVGKIETRPVTIDIEKAVLWSLELRPELQSETYKAQMDAISVNLAQSRRTPTVFISGDYDLMTQDFPVNKNNWDATLGLKLPFAYDYWSELTKKRAQQRQGDISRAELQDQVRLEVREAFSDLMFWQKQYPILNSEYEKMEGLYHQASKNAGKTLLKIRALSSLLGIQTAYLKAVTQHLLAKARLERAVGREITR